MKEKKKFNFGYILAVITTIIWGSSYVASGIAFEDFQPFEVGSFRMILGSLGLFILARFVMRLSLRVDKSDIPMFFLIGALGYFVSTSCTLFSTNYAGSTLASLLNSTNPIAISLFATLILRERIRLKQVILLAIALCGVYIVCSSDFSGATFLGIVFCVASILAWAIATNFNKKMTGRYHALVITFWAVTCSLAFNVPSLAISVAINGLPQPSFKSILALLYLGLVGTSVAHGLWATAMSKLPASVCSMFYPIQPLSSALIGVIFFHEILTWRLIVGGLIICGAIILNVVNFKKTPRI